MVYPVNNPSRPRPPVTQTLLHSLHLCCWIAYAASKEKLVRHYLRNAGFYSYDAASAEEEDSVKRWIEHEVKRFLQEAHMHLSLLLRLASAPPDTCPGMEQHANEEEQLCMADADEDDEYAPIADELHEREAYEPVMMVNAERRDRFLSFVKEIQRPWARG
eukprot:4131278-Pleurochrysis_carterae.AAC.1